MKYGKNISDKKVWLGGALAIALLLFLWGLAPSARANPISDFFSSLLEPLWDAANAPTSSAQSAAPLYQPAIDYEKAVIAAVKRAAPSVVSIVISKNVPIIEQCPSNPFSDLPPEFRRFFEEVPEFYVPCERGTRFEEVGGGSGFIISGDGLIITNKHVVGDSSASYTVFTNDGKRYEARVLAKDPVLDLAVIKIEASGLPTVVLGDSDSLELGQTAIAIGNALGEFRNTVSVGVISGLARNVTASGPGVTETIHGVVQTDAAINPGNSGGPLLNLRGEVIGINTAVAAGAQNIGFAIPINQAKRDIESVKRTGEIVVPFLGVRHTAITPEFARQQNLGVDYGALVRGTENNSAVTPGSPAERAGIREGDIILEMDGRRIDRDYPLGAAISQHTVGDRVDLKIRRDGRDINLTVELARRPATQ